MSASFKIIFNGQLHQNADISTVQDQLCQFLKIPHNVAVKLFDGKAYALVKNLSSIDAVKTEVQLKNFGLITKVEPHAKITAVEKPALSKQLIVTKNDSAIKAATSKIKSISPLINSPAKLPKIALQSALFFCYSLLFICIICAAVISINTLQKNIISKPVDVLPTLSYSNYKQYLNNQNNRTEVAIENRDNTENLQKEPQQHINSYFTSFSSLINNYADILNQPNIESMGGEKLKQHLQEIDALGDTHLFWQQLISLAKSLNNDAYLMSLLANNDPNKIQWINAVDWISQSYIRQQQSQPKAIQSTPTDTMQADSPILDLTLLISLMSFLTLIIISIKMKVRSIKMKLAAISTE